MKKSVGTGDEDEETLEKKYNSRQEYSERMKHKLSAWQQMILANTY